MSICNEKLPFIFISYSHRDTFAVIPIINRLRAEGYNVWYDDGIEPGSEWDDNIANHIMNCSYFISFISKNYLGSDNCKDELKYCRDLNKEQLLVYLEEVTLPGGMAMRMNRIQAIMWNRFHPNNIESAYQKLFSAVGIEKTRVFPRAIPQPVVQPTQQTVPVQHGAPMPQKPPVQPMQQTVPVQHGAPMPQKPPVQPTQRTVPVQHGSPMPQKPPVQPMQQTVPMQQKPPAQPMQQPVPVQHGSPMPQKTPVPQMQQAVPMQQKPPAQPMQQPVPVQHGSPMPQKTPVPPVQQGTPMPQNAPTLQKAPVQQPGPIQANQAMSSANVNQLGKPSVEQEKKKQNSVVKLILLIVAGILLLMLLAILIIGGILLVGSSSNSNNVNTQNNVGNDEVLNFDDHYMMTIDELEERAADGDAEAMFILGDCYLNGENGVEISIEDAIYWYEMSAENGYDYAPGIIAYIYCLEGDYVDYSKAVYWATVAVENDPNDTYMLYLLGGCYYEGDSTLDPDYELAFSYYLQAAELGLEDAMYMVALFYDYGLGVEQDSEEAEKWYKAYEEATGSD